MNEKDAVQALVSDLHWQIDQLKTRRITDKAGNPYNPSYYKRGLKASIARGGREVADYVASYVYKSPSAGYKKLQDAESLDLVCEALVADETKPYAQLFTDEERAAAKKRLAPYLAEIERRKAAAHARIDDHQTGLTKDLTELQALAAAQPPPEEAVAINRAIVDQAPDDVVALNRLGRALEQLNRLDEAIATFERVLEVDPDNTIAPRRIEGLRRQQ